MPVLHRPVETAVVSAYSTKEIRTLMAAASLDDKDLFMFFLCSGARKSEVRFAAWIHLDFTARTFTIRQKLDCRFTPKSREEGTVLLPQALIILLEQRKLRFPATRFVFELQSGNTEDHALTRLKQLALRANLNCGGCKTHAGLSCSTHPVCSRFVLHKFRKTFATLLHEAGIPATTIQRWLRHASLETTMQYLASSDDRNPKTGRAVNKTFVGFA